MGKHIIIYLLLLFFSLSIYAEKSTVYCDQLILKGVHELYKKDFSKSIELLNKAKILAIKNNWHKQLFLAKNNIGLNYYFLYQYNDAIENYLEAYDIAINNLDSNFEMIVLTNIGMLYLKEKKYNDAEKYCLKAYNLATVNKNNFKIGMYAANLALVYSQLKNLTKVKQYIEIATPLVKNNPNNLFQIEITKAEYLIQRKEFEQAKLDLLKLNQEIDTKKYNEYKVSVLLLLAKIYEEKEADVSTAIQYAKEALEIDLDLSSKIETNERLYKLFLKNNQPEKASLYKESSYLIKDSLNKIKSKILFDNIKTKLKIQSFQKELSENKKKLDKERLINITLIVLFLIIILITIWAIKSSLTKFKQRKIIADHHQKITQLELENTNKEKQILETKLKEKEVTTLLEQEQLKNEIESKNRKIAVKALQSANRNELIEEIINSISSQPEIAKNQDLKANILKLKNQLKSNNEWNDFLIHFEEVNQSFLSKLKLTHQDLTSNDIRFLLYMYMDLSTKEIASLLNVTHEACRKRKERIAKKMGLSDSNSIYGYLSAM